MFLFSFFQKQVVLHTYLYLPICGTDHLPLSLIYNECGKKVYQLSTIFLCPFATQIEFSLYFDNGEY